MIATPITTKYRVFPLAPEPVPFKDWGAGLFWSAVGGLVVGLVVYAIFEGKINNNVAAGLAFLAGTVTGLATFYTFFQYLKRTQRQSSNSEAERLTSYVSSITTRMSTTLEEIYKRYGSVVELLNLSETEYASSAFAPFWDAIERAAEELATCCGLARTLAEDIRKQRDTLRNRRHTFPLPAVRVGELSDMEGASQRLSEIARIAQTNFQFAVIAEQRPSRSRVAWFASLRDAIGGLPGAARDSLRMLEASLQDQPVQLWD